ncbi:hypothetical protein [Winogradskyella haliclonae]|uniref:Aspartyl protease n=1 Tax=Winogradskyella haliclonae TaxID=2048558 RepID=A0ABQ2C3G7_9FLAO|nr:hypothetical protein [Winogradskyella haliclonae]GGI57668.1 hypothetical protein GCM10011444_19770 [Winogradskyella haliclonae]
MKKKIGYTLLFLLVLILSVGYYYIRKFNNAFFKEKSAYMEYTFESKPIHFDWASSYKGSGGYHEPQAAIIIPVKIENLTHRFYMQFDTGAPHSFIYEKDLKSLRKIGLNIEEVTKGEERFVEALNFKLDSTTINAKMIRILENYGNSFDKTDTISNLNIGTIGSDFITNRITSIDFKNQTLELYEQRPKWMKTKSEFKPFDFTGRRIMLPVVIDNKDYELFYDSGCSAFGLITIKSRFDKYTDENTEAIAYNAKSWNSSIAITSKVSNKRFKIGNTELSLKRVSHVDMYNAIQPLVTPFTRIGGWLGNQPFNDKILILDTKAEEFIILEN